VTLEQAGEPTVAARIREAVFGLMRPAPRRHGVPHRHAEGQPTGPPPQSALRRVAILLALPGRPLMVRLLVVLLPTTLATAALGVLKATEATPDDRTLARAERYAAVSQVALQAAMDLENERDTAAGARRSALRLEEAYAQSDADLRSLDTAAEQTGDQALRFARADLRARLDGLPDLRRTGFGDLAATTTVSRYSTVIGEVVKLGRIADGRAILLAGAAKRDSLGLYDLVVAAGVNAERRALGTALLERGRPATGERSRLGGLADRVEQSTDAFRSVATPATLALFQSAGVDEAAGDVDLLAERVTASGADSSVPVATWTEVTSSYLDRVRLVITKTDARGAAAIAEQRRDRSDRTRRGLALIVAVLVATALSTALIGYGLTTDLRRLRDRMRRAADGTAAGSGGTAAGSGPAPRRRNEIDQVARVFDEVHAGLTRTAAEQTRNRETLAAATRTTVRRTQDLLRTQQEVLTDLQRRPAEPATPDQLHTLDHLAGRVRRHGDNLLVLAGGDPAGQWPLPAALAAVVSAAVTATEHYRRVRTGPLPAVDVAAPAVVALTRILTELVDNAARFSAPDRPVRVTAGYDAGGVRLEVRDEGPGFGVRTGALLEVRLAGREADRGHDEPALGLQVVSMLAARTGVGVRLVALDDGCVATVTVPPELLTADPALPAAAAPAPAPQATMTATPAPQATAAPAPQAMMTAAPAPAPQTMTTAAPTPAPQTMTTAAPTPAPHAMMTSAPGGIAAPGAAGLAAGSAEPAAAERPGASTGVPSGAC
jgi:signal transduction histidine kinase